MGIIGRFVLAFWQVNACREPGAERLSWFDEWIRIEGNSFERSLKE